MASRGLAALHEPDVLIPIQGYERAVSQLGHVLASLHCESIAGLSDKFQSRQKPRNCALTSFGLSSIGKWPVLERTCAVIVAQRLHKVSAPETSTAWSCLPQCNRMGTSIFSMVVSRCGLSPRASLKMVRALAFRCSARRQ